MQGLESAGQTIGVVEKLTGIPKRTLKYFIEQGMMEPTCKSSAGYWLYSREDIQKVRIIALYRELGYSNQKVKALLSEADIAWRRELDAHIRYLFEERDKVERQLFAAEYFRYQNARNPVDQWLNIDKKEELPQCNEEMKWRVCSAFCNALVWAVEKERLRERICLLLRQEPDSREVQEQMDQLCKHIEQRWQLSPERLLLEFRLAGIFSGIAVWVDLLLERRGSMRFLTDALQVYCSKAGCLKTVQEEL